MKRMVATALVWLIGAALATAWAAGRLAARFQIVGPSMEPVLRDGDRVLVNSAVYALRWPRPGEVVLARVPAVPGGFAVKRIAHGLPGSHGREGAGALTMAGGSPAWFVLIGDNAAASADSRRFGSVPREQIVGRVWYRYWPPERRGPVR